MCATCVDLPDRVHKKSSLVDMNHQQCGDPEYHHNYYLADAGVCAETSDLFIYENSTKDSAGKQQIKASPEPNV